MHAWVMNAVERALSGESLDDEALLSLLGLDPYSAECAHVRWGSETLARRASGNQGRIYAQIGVDMIPCPVDCAFCTLSRVNASPDVKDADPETLVVPTDTIVEYARVFKEAGAHVISLMATAALPFDRYLDIVSSVRAVVGDAASVLANYGDMSFAQAGRLAQAGADMAYHAHRLGEGELTRASSAQRLATMRNIKAVGMQLMCGVEPLYEDLENDAVLARMHEALSFEPYCAGVAGLHAVDGTKMQTAKPMNGPKLQLYAAVMRLMAGEKLPFGCGGRNVLWADAGTNPRGRDLCCDPEFLRRDVIRLKKDLTSRGWDVQ